MDFSFLRQSQLFKGMDSSQIKKLICALDCKIKSYKKNQGIYHIGQKISEAGLILKGSVQMESLDLLATRSILGIAEAGDLFAESYACIPNRLSLFP